MASRASGATAPGAADPGFDAVRTVAQDLRGATFEIRPGPARFDSLELEGVRYTRVSMRGATSAGEPGHPALPALVVPFAVPEGMSPRVRVLAEDWASRPGSTPLSVPRERFLEDDPRSGPTTAIRFEPDPAIYGSGLLYPAAAVVLGEGSPLGSLWTVPAIVRPVRYDFGTRSFRLLLRLEIRVDFVPASEREQARRPPRRPGADSDPWRRLQEATVRNAQAARLFPFRSAPAWRSAPRRAVAGAQEFRIAITATGWSSVTHAALAGAGFPSGVAIASIGIEERGYDEAGDSATVVPLPVVARDPNGDGLFNSGDAISFFARNLRDRFGATAQENRYAEANVVWLTWGGGAAPTPGPIPGANLDPAPLQPTAFEETLLLEQNLQMLGVPSTSAGSPPENVETFFWANGEAPDNFTATLPFLDPDPAGAVRIRARYQGQSGSTHRLNIFLDGSDGSVDTLGLFQTFFNQSVYVLDTGFTIPGAHIVGAGTSRYRHTGERQPNGVGSFVQGSRAWLDWIEATYSRQYLARGNALAFTSGATGGVAELRVTGFTQAGVEVYDVTDPVVPLRVTGVIESNPVPGSYEILFQTDATAGLRRFAALVPGSEIPLGAGSVLPDTTSALAVPGVFPAGSAARAIVIAPRAFLTPAERLADHRRGQGYVVEVARVEDVYDEFGGGIKSPLAVRRYLRHAHRTWSPAPVFVVLAGDASMDYKHYLQRSAVDWIPTYLKFETISGPAGSELVAHDSFYTLDLASARPSDVSFTPSLILGRIPASSAAELDQYVSKVVQYELFQPTDVWRGRQILLSDDEFSSTIFFNAGYCQQPPEAMFRSANQDFADATQASPSGQDIRSDFFDLKTYSDLVPTFPVGGVPCRNLLDVVNAFRTTNNAVDQFHAQVAAGALILNAQAHANRYLIAHEQIYVTFAGSFGDRDRLSNFGRPVFLMVWGCHANQFPDGPAGGSIDSTDAIGEQWIMLPNTGSIASFGSSGYELLSTNAVYNGIVADAFYTSPPPVAPLPRRARWILGEVMGLAALRNAAIPSFLQQVMNRTLNLAGDPMLRMDALPPRIFEVTLDGTPAADGDPLVSASPIDSVLLVAKVRDETALKSTELAERAVPGGGIATLDPSLFSVAVADTGRENVLSARVRPRVANYDLLVRAIDANDRERLFALQVRTPVRYFANGIEILSGVFAAGDAVLRAEVTTPIPVTEDSLELVLDGAVIFATKTALDGTGRRWAMESLPEQRGPGTHTLGIAVGGRTAGFDTISYAVDTGFTLRGVAVVSPRAQGAGCDGSVFQYELSAPARSVRLLLLTVSGRRVASLEWPGVTGYNVRCWDGRDSQGHAAATGLYLFRLTATDAQGRSTSRSGRMIRTR